MGGIMPGRGAVDTTGVGLAIGGAIWSGARATIVVLSVNAFGRAGSSVPRTLGAEVWMTFLARTTAMGSSVPRKSFGMSDFGVVMLASSTRLCCNR